MSGVELGGQNAQFDNPGDEVSGEVLSAELTDQTDMNTGERVYWDAEKTRPKQMIAVKLHAPGHKDAGDDGAVMVHVSGNKWTAVKRVTSRIDPGAWLYIKFREFSDRDPKVKGHNRAKLYDAAYKAPGTWKGASMESTAPAAEDKPPF